MAGAGCARSKPHRRNPTFGISGLLGGILAALADAVEFMSVLVAGFLGFAAVLAWYKAREATHDEDFSVTGVVAGLGVFSRLAPLPLPVTTALQPQADQHLRPVLASREVSTGCCAGLPGSNCARP